MWIGGAPPNLRSIFGSFELPIVQMQPGEATMFRMIHHSTARGCLALVRAIVDRFDVPERYLLSGCDITASTPDKKNYAVFFDSDTMLSDHRNAMAAPVVGHATIILVGVPPSMEALSSFATGFDYGMMFAGG